jgi:hypothetical protein
MMVLVFLVGTALGAVIAWRHGRASALSQSRTEMRKELTLAKADMGREVRHWQDAATRATSEAARIAREAEAYKAGCKDGREDVISIMPLLVAAQQRSVDEAGTSDAELRAVADGNDGT